MLNRGWLVLLGGLGVLLGQNVAHACSCSLDGWDLRHDFESGEVPIFEARIGEEAGGQVSVHPIRVWSGTAPDRIQLGSGSCFAGVPEVGSRMFFVGGYYDPCSIFADSRTPAYAEWVGELGTGTWLM